MNATTRKLAARRNDLFAQLDELELTEGPGFSASKEIINHEISLINNKLFG